MQRVIDTVIFLGKQELSFRGHVESLAADSSVNVGNFLEALKHLAVYDQTIAHHLAKVEVQHQKLEERKANTEKGDKRRKAGRGSKLTFLSNDTRNKLIAIIATESVRGDCMAWALIADTTPDATKHEHRCKNS